MDNVYTGDDRVRQVVYVQDLAANIAFGSDDPSTSAQERVDYYCTEFADELPPWFDDHDKALLVRLVEPELGDDEDPDDYDPIWDSETESAAHFGGRTWRTCRHGYTVGECPTCDGDERSD